MDKYLVYNILKTVWENLEAGDYDGEVFKANIKMELDKDALDKLEFAVWQLQGDIEEDE